MFVYSIVLGLVAFLLINLVPPFRSRLSVFKLSIKELERLGSVTSRGRGKRSLLIQ